MNKIKNIEFSDEVMFDVATIFLAELNLDKKIDSADIILNSNVFSNRFINQLKKTIIELDDYFEIDFYDACYRLINNKKECYLKIDEKIINTEYFPEFNRLNVLFIILNILYIIENRYDIKLNYSFILEIETLLLTSKEYNEIAEEIIEALEFYIRFEEKLNNIRFHLNEKYENIFRDIENKIKNNVYIL